MGSTSCLLRLPRAAAESFWISAPQTAERTERYRVRDEEGVRTDAVWSGDLLKMTRGRSPPGFTRHNRLISAQHLRLNTLTPQLEHKRRRMAHTLTFNTSARGWKEYSPNYKNTKNVLALRASKIRMSLFLNQIWRNVSLHHLLTNGSSEVNGCRQIESPNSW